MQSKPWLKTLGFLVCLWISHSKAEEEVICGRKYVYVQCKNAAEKIRVHDVIYGHVVGRNECNTQPTSNCTATNGFCEVAEKTEGRRGEWLHPTQTINPPPCGGTGIYIIIDYSCLKDDITLPGENFALEKPTKQSTTHGSLSASKAVDGKKNKYHTFCTHTAADKQNPWWRVDLKQRIAVTRVKIVNRNIAGKRLCGFEIRIGDSLKNNGITSKRCGSQQHIPSNQEGIVSCVPEVIGRYVTIFIPGEKETLTLCEVEVYGTSVLGNQSRTKIELVGSNLPYQGYIVNNTETLCDPTWSMNDANVACIQLGYLGVDEAHRNNSYPASQNEGNTVERRYNCSGTEGSLSDCPQIIVDGKNTCRKGNDISVACQPYIRLGGSDIPLKGRLEVFHLGMWGTVCGFSPSFEDRSSRVTCRELGFHDVLNQGSWDGDKTSGKIWLKDVKCSGDEKSLVFCPHNNWKNTGCNHAADIFVKCSICPNGLLEDNALFPDSIFNASAARLPDYGPSSGRLYSPQPWCLPESIVYENQFLEITLPGIFSLSTVATVGGELGYVTSYMLSYMISGYTWKYASVGTQKLIFGNTNDETHNVIRRDLDSPIHAENVRFIPKTWQRVPCLRVELCGKEIPRCNPRNITVNDLSSNSVRISWLPIRLPTNTLHMNYSVTITRNADNDIQYFKTTEQYLLIPILLPHNLYTCTVKAVGLEECFDEELKLYFETKQAAPSGPPRNILVKSMDSTEVTVDWFPPFSNQTNGIITSYQLCYSMERLQENCTGNSTILRREVKTPVKTSLTLDELLPATMYFFRIRASTVAGPGPYTKEYKTITSSEELPISNQGEKTSHSFYLQLQKPPNGYRYVQIIVMELKDSTPPDPPPYTYTSDLISTANESVGTLKPYVTAQLTVDEVNELNNFVVGDGKNYGHPARRRRGVEKFTARFDEVGGRRRTDRSEGSRKPTLFYNRPLMADSIYSAFQRTFVDENTYYSSSWSEPVRTNMMELENKEPSKTDNGSETGKLIGIGIGGAVVFIILVILLIFFLLKMKKKKKLSRRGSKKNMMKNNISDSHFDDNVQCDNHDSKQSVAMNNLGADASLYETVDDTDGRDTDSETEDTIGENADNAGIYGNAKVAVTRDPFRMVPAEEFESYVADMKKNDNFGFDKQFKELPQGICYPCTIAKSRANKPKNRYANIVSYDDALVPLSDSDSETYINASFISGVEPKSYIATQGPTEKTVSAFWKMIWEQNSQIIVMLTNLKEKDKEKCTKYWTKTSTSFGNITVTFQEKELFPFYVTRKFLIEKDGVKRSVTQFHFTSWPDHGVPKYPTQLLSFQHAVRSSGLKITGPLIVHCSAGVGRTGTFLVIDHCLENFLRQGEKLSVDVFHIVQEMRERRVNMIQTIEQYILAHEAILEFILCGFNEVEGHDLQSAIETLKKINPKTKQTGFAELFQRLKNFSPVLTKQDCKAATLEKNSGKNRTMEICPADIARVALSSKNSDYINATYVDGFQQKKAYIATDSPMVNTFDEFWQMVYEQKSPVVIMLNNCIEGMEKYPEYFPNEKEGTAKYANLYVRLDEHVADKDPVFRKFSVSSTSDFKSAHILRHFQCTKWPERGVPEKPDNILQLLQTIQTAQRQNVQGPMVVHCSNGAGRTGTFIAINICMERLKMEQRVDVFHCIKLIREKRPQFIENELQLQFCYEVLAKYIQSFAEYSNFLATD